MGVIDDQVRLFLGGFRVLVSSRWQQKIELSVDIYLLFKRENCFTNENFQRRAVEWQSGQEEKSYSKLFVNTIINCRSNISDNFVFLHK
jgi:hypothetical protein